MRMMWGTWILVDELKKESLWAPLEIYFDNALEPGRVPVADDTV